ncbi:hypothetical protein [Nocardia africana]|uniref:hypothetical protein n=1 Tax=Nocardia africana TaxID=134964 RepID=UPI000A91AA83|nr:hypothetical protein [Nocardia africana]MCC3311941.1 hypothetical protein [Nocardia africana]
MATHEPGGGPGDRDSHDPRDTPSTGEDNTGAGAESGESKDIGASDPTVRSGAEPGGERESVASEAEPAKRLGEPDPTLPNPRTAPTLPGAPILPGFQEPTAPIPGLGTPGVPNPLSDNAFGIDVGGSTGSEGENPDAAGESKPRRMRGSMQRQEAGVTQPRPPTVAEARARDKARKRAEEAERAAAEAAEAKRRKRKRLLIGGVAVAGIAAVVGTGYLAYQAAHRPANVTAYCITDDNGRQQVVPDDDCVRAQSYTTSSGYYGGGGLGPGIFLYNGHQYRYYYGGNNAVGRAPVGGSTVEPKKATVSTKSGTVVRGGLGSKSGSTSGGS